MSKRILKEELDTIQKQQGFTRMIETVLFHSNSNTDVLDSCFENKAVLKQIKSEGMNKGEQEYLLKNLDADKISVLYDDGMLNEIKPKEMFNFFDNRGYCSEACGVLLNNKETAITDVETFYDFLNSQIEHDFEKGYDLSDTVKFLFRHFHDQMSFDTFPAYMSIEYFEDFCDDEMSDCNDYETLYDEYEEKITNLIINQTAIKDVDEAENYISNLDIDLQSYSYADLYYFISSNDDLSDIDYDDYDFDELREVQINKITEALKSDLMRYVNDFDFKSIEKSPSI